MKRKLLLVVYLCTFGLCTWEAQALSHEQRSIAIIGDNVPTGFEKITLQGTLMYGNNPNAIVAGANESSVYIHFNQSFGNVSITITNETGHTVYYTVVDTSVQQTVIIPLTNAASGIYTVSLDNANGFAEGDFEHD